MLLPKGAVRDRKKWIYIKEPELLSNLVIKTPLSNIPLIVNILI